MRTRIVLSVLLVLLVALFYFSKPKANENSVSNIVSAASTGDTTFRIGAWWNGKVIHNYDSLKELGMNLWHITGRISNGWTEVGVPNDYRESDYNDYGQNVLNRIDSNYTFGNMKSIMDRSKINYLAFGKRSDYECEENNINLNYWFYAYREHDTSVSRDLLDNSQYGGNSTFVRYSSTSEGKTAGYVVKSLIANREQQSFTFDELESWYVMPRIRIDSSFAANPANDNVPVCYIELKNYYGNSILGKERINLYVRHFKLNGIYNGQYLYQYNFLTIDTNLFIDSTQKFNPDHKSHADTNCRVDFRVWWCGQCDMWLDRVRVENEIAYDLFGDNSDSTNYKKYQNWLLWEANYIAEAEAGKAHYFLIDEPEFATLPALSYLNKKIIQLSNNTTSLVPIFARWNFKASLPNFEQIDYSVEQLKTYLIDSLGLKMYYTESYPFYGWDCCSKLPNTLPRNFSSYDPVNGLLGQPVSPSEYEYWLQNYMDESIHLIPGTDEFIKTVKYAYELFKQYNLPFSFMVQQHINYAGDGQLREPTNEEIAMMTNVAVSYGAKEITFFPYTGYGYLPAPNPNNINYCRGLADPFTLNKRVSNVYWQNKWEGVKAVTTKLTKWGPKLMSFTNTNTNSYIYRNQTERGLLNSNSCFIYFSTLKSGSGTPDCGNQEHTPDNIPQGFTYDCEDSTYLQIATFKNSEPNTEYFMVVNRRCSPYKDESSEDNRGGKRNVKAYLKPNYSAFTNFDRWKIINIEDNSVTAVFYKNNPDIIDLGIYKPGEGKLYKIVPYNQ